MHAGKRRRQRCTRALPRDRSPQEPAARDRWHVKGFTPAGWREPRLAQELIDLAARIWPPMTERRRIHSRPDATPVRDDRKQPSARRKHAPHFAQKCPWI